MIQDSLFWLAYAAAANTSIRQSPEISLQNAHSIDPTVRKPIENEVHTTLERSVREIRKIWQTPRIKDDSLVKTKDS